MVKRGNSHDRASQSGMSLGTTWNVLMEGAKAAEANNPDFHDVTSRRVARPESHAPQPAHSASSGSTWLNNLIVDPHAEGHTGHSGEVSSAQKHPSGAQTGPQKGTQSDKGKRPMGRPKGYPSWNSGLRGVKTNNKRASAWNSGVSGEQLTALRAAIAAAPKPPKPPQPPRKAPPRHPAWNRGLVDVKRKIGPLTKEETERQAEKQAEKQKALHPSEHDSGSLPREGKPKRQSWNAGTSLQRKIGPLTKEQAEKVAARPKRQAWNAGTSLKRKIGPLTKEETEKQAAKTKEKEAKKAKASKAGISHVAS